MNNPNANDQQFVLPVTMELGDLGQQEASVSGFYTIDDIHIGVTIEKLVVDVLGPQNLVDLLEPGVNRLLSTELATEILSEINNGGME